MTSLPEEQVLAVRGSTDITVREKLFCLLVVVGSLFYCGSVFFHHAINAGQADDLVDGLWFFEIYSSRTSWLEKLPVLFLPNHEHITLFNHLFYLADYAVFGQLNFFHCMLAGQVIVLCSCLVLACWLRSAIGWWYACAIAFGVFYNLFYWHAGFWAMTALSNQGVILFMLLAAWSAWRHPAGVWWPLCWALCAVLTQFNGLLVLPALALSSYLSSRATGEAPRWRQLFVWSATFALTTAAYFSYESPFAADHLWRYVSYTDPDNLQDYIKPSGLPVQMDATIVLNALLTLFASVGASVFGLGSWLPAAVVGAIMLLVLLCGSVCWQQSDRFWLTVLLFVLASLLLVSVGRGMGFGPESGLLYRYRLYSFLLLVLLLAGLLRSRSHTVVLRAILPLCFFVQLSSWHVLDDIARERANIRASYYFWLVDGGLGRTQMPFYPHNQDWRLFHAHERGYYSAYAALDDSQRPQSVAPVPASECEAVAGELPATTLVRAWSKKARALAVEIGVDVAPVPAVASLLFCSEAGAYRLMLSERNADRTTGRYLPVLVLKKQLPPAQYRVSWQAAGHSAQVLGLVNFP